MIFCPRAGQEVEYCHGWALRNELCHDADECEPYLEFAENRLMELQGKRRKIPLPPELWRALEARAYAGKTNQDVEREILEEMPVIPYVAEVVKVGVMDC